MICSDRDHWRDAIPVTLFHAGPAESVQANQYGDGMSDRTVLITGAAGGLGGAVTEAFLAEGWRVVAAGRPGSAARMPAGSEPVEADLTDPVAVSGVADLAAADPGAPLRAVVNLVGGFAAGDRVHQTPYAQFEAMLVLNLRPTYLVTAATLPHLAAAGGGSVVCVASQAAVRPFPGAAGYVTAKAAVLGFARAVAVEYGPDRIRCNTVLPGMIDTPGNRAAMPDADRAAWVAPAAIAGVITFLAGDASAPTTGAEIPVSGTG